MTRLVALARNPWARGIFVLASLVLAIVLLWWRGPDWNTVYHAFDFVQWRWVAVGVVLNLGVWLALRVLFREVREQRLGPLVLDLPDLRTLDPVALALAALGFAAMTWGKRSMITVIGWSAVVGMACRLAASW